MDDKQRLYKNKLLRSPSRDSGKVVDTAFTRDQDGGGGG